MESIRFPASALAGMFSRPNPAAAAAVPRVAPVVTRPLPQIPQLQQPVVPAANNFGTMLLSLIFTLSVYIITTLISRFSYFPLHCLSKVFQVIYSFPINAKKHLMRNTFFGFCS